MFDVLEISAILDGSADEIRENAIIKEVGIDSRLVVDFKAALFICMPGQRRQGYEFIEGLYQSGVRHFVVQKNTPYDRLPGATYFEVINPLDALQQLAAHYRRKWCFPVVGITGSNGKTIVKEWLYDLLKSHIVVQRSPGSYNSQIGVALSILSMSSKADLAIIEAGISRPGEMSKLEKMIQPTFGIFTNLGDAHDVGFADRSQKLEEKISLFKNCQWWISQTKIADTPALLTWKEAAHSGTLDIINGQLFFQAKSISSPFTDKASIENLGHCLAFCSKYRPDLMPQVLALVPRLSQVEMRSEVRQGIRECRVISDHYNLDLESLSNVLDLANQINNHLPSILIISDFVDHPSEPDFYQRVLDLVNRSEVYQIIVIGSEWASHWPSLKGRMDHWRHYEKTKDFLESDAIKSWSSQLIILKGARDFQFEKIESRLVRPVYGTQLEIDLSALRHNFLALQQMTSPEVKKMVMVKASAYGSGSNELASFYEENQIDFLGVAYANEGVSLRESGVTVPIMVMNAEPRSLRILQDFDLQPEIHGLDHLRSFLQELSEGEKLSIHIKCETGMNRLGFEEEDIEGLVDILKQNSHRLNVVSIFSHFSSADMPLADDYSLGQLQKFKKMAGVLTSNLNDRPLWHIANSSATLRFPEAHMDMVRLGIALYGVSIPEKFRTQFYPVHSLKTYIVQIKERKPGDRIGYGMEGEVHRLSRIATIPLGYADGVPRKLGNGRLKVWVNGHLAPSIGRICMDMTMIDVTDIPDCQRHDEVEIFGKNMPLDQFAHQCDTIAYEVLVHLGNRIERVIKKA